jgi:glycosyltransferase involved in cell wall biosynthesis
LPSGAYEVLVVNPESPDGTHEYLAAVASSYPHVRVREVPVEAKLAINKAAMINRAFEASKGEWIWLTDADCLFSPTAAETTLAQIHSRPKSLLFGQRRYLTSSQTSELLAGRRDGLNDFETLCLNVGPRKPDHDPWGYTQIVSRSTLERVPYREQVNHFAHSDSLFIQDCARRRIFPAPVDGLFCLHLDHPFAWYGTKAFL